MQIADLTGVEGRGENRIIQILQRSCTSLNLQFDRENVIQPCMRRGRNF
jgi:hypothetical protein